MKIRFNLRVGISTQVSKILIFSGSCGAFVFNSFGHNVKIRMNPRDGGLPKRPNLYISSLKHAGFAGSGVTLSLNLLGCILRQGHKTIIFSGSCNTLLFDSFGTGVKIRINPRDGGFSKQLKLCIKSLTFPVLLDLD